MLLSTRRRKPIEGRGGKRRYCSEGPESKKGNTKFRASWGEEIQQKGRGGN